MIIDDKAIILNMLANKGIYHTDDDEPDDPPAVLIYQYYSLLGGHITYAIYYKYTPLVASEFAHNPILLMEEGTLTDAGRKMLEAFKAEEYPLDVRDNHRLDDPEYPPEGTMNRTDMRY